MPVLIKSHLNFILTNLEKYFTLTFYILVVVLCIDLIDVIFYSIQILKNIT